jgi:hypothetical protein
MVVANAAALATLAREFQALVMARADIDTVGYPESFAEQHQNTR